VQDQVLQWLSVLSGVVSLVCLIPKIPWRPKSNGATTFANFNFRICPKEVTTCYNMLQLNPRVCGGLSVYQMIYHQFPCQDVRKLIAASSPLLDNPSFFCELLHWNKVQVCPNLHWLSPKVGDLTFCGQNIWSVARKVWLVASGRFPMVRTYSLFGASNKMGQMAKFSATTSTGGRDT